MTDDELAQLLFVKDEPQPGDLALVFGHQDRTVAARLYRAGFVPTILLSGGMVRGAVSEAEEMALAILAEEIPEEHLLLERSSRNTFENVGKSLELLRDKGLWRDTATVLLVSCPWHMRRVLLTARQAFPAGTRLFCCPHEESCTEDSWARSPECRAAVLGEWQILTAFVSGGLLASP